MLVRAQRGVVQFGAVGEGRERKKRRYVCTITSGMDDQGANRSKELIV